MSTFPRFGMVSAEVGDLDVGAKVGDLVGADVGDCVGARVGDVVGAGVSAIGR